MKRIKFNNEWKFIKGSSASMMAAFLGGGCESEVQLPHDAMIHEKVLENTKNGAQTGFYPGGEYIYKKTFWVPDSWREKSIIIEFEGVYQTAMIYVNGDFVDRNLYGYAGFYVNLNGFLKYGEVNEIKVVVDNSAEPNSRWYTGSGIYRNVNLILGDKIHFALDSLKIRTITADMESAVIEVEYALSNRFSETKKARVEIEIMRNNSIVVSDRQEVTLFPEDSEVCRFSFCIANPDLWECDSPALYECKIKAFNENEEIDSVSEKFGIRTVVVDSKHGLRINGKEVKLRGTCIHHDNGIIGAATYEKAEERKCEILKNAGFNSIRSAHHPISKAMLSACDKYGILVMDELCDMWTIHKNPHDFALFFSNEWEKEIERMVVKDYNHPSVILYSVGNEIAEVGTPAGRKMNRRLCNKFHELDNTRYTINGLNGIMAISFSSQLDEIMKDVMAEHMDEMKAFFAKTEGLEGSNELNQFLSFMNGDGADIFACHPILTETLEEAALSADIIGLNYLTGRHTLEKKIHPNKTVIGTETYPADIVRLWKIVKNNHHVLGDFTWTGYDYLGEAGCGIFHYDGNVNFTSIYPERLAYIGDINLIGYRRPISYLREIVYGLRKKPYIAVERVDRYGMEHSKTLWMYKDNIASWTWDGYEGKPAVVDVYSDSEEVELFLNGKSMGRKATGEKNEYTAKYELNYEPGELLAVSYDDGEAVDRYSLKTAKSQVEMLVEADKLILEATGEDLAFITVKLVDEDGVENLWEKREIKVSVKGAGTLQGFGSAEPSTEKSYDDTAWTTFDGYVMAVIRAGYEPGEIKVLFEAEECESKEINLQVSGE